MAGKSDDKNIGAIKRFIEAQILSGEKYNYAVVQERFDKVLAKESNAVLRSYGMILEKVNKSYERMLRGDQLDISDWYIGKLREFVTKYRQVHTEVAASNKVQKEYQNTPSQSIISSKTRYIAGIPMRGNYYQEAAVDEFGCVLVCD
jgi:hypothetical protein